MGDRKTIGWAIFYSFIICVAGDIFISVAVSPYLASKIEKNPIDIKIIKEKFNKLKGKYDYLICEGSGGATCPLTDVDNKIYTFDSRLSKEQRYFY